MRALCAGAAQGESLYIIYRQQDTRQLLTLPVDRAIRVGPAQGVLMILMRASGLI